MGNAAEVFRWNSIDPHTTVGVFIHPYGQNEFASFDIVLNLATNEPAGAFTSIAAQLTDGPTNLFPPDGATALAHTLWVENQTVGPQPYITVGLIEFSQTF
jgi:hypothetical protein